jgi:hypothetical protein
MDLGKYKTIFIAFDVQLNYLNFLLIYFLFIDSVLLLKNELKSMSRIFVISERASHIQFIKSPKPNQNVEITK